jgi:hypothetical protein
MSIASSRPGPFPGHECETGCYPDRPCTASPTDYNEAFLHECVDRKQRLMKVQSNRQGILCRIYGTVFCSSVQVPVCGRFNDEYSEPNRVRVAGRWPWPRLNWYLRARESPESLLIAGFAGFRERKGGS